MNIEKNKILTALAPVIIREQQNIETDIILPDYFDNISKVLKCSVTPKIEAYTPSSDRLSVAGKAEISLFYMGEDKKLYNYESEIKYTKVLNSSGIEIKDNFYVEQNTISLNYRATGPKKIDIKCAVDVIMNIFKIEETEFITSIDDETVFHRVKNSEITVFDGLFNKTFSISHDIQSIEESYRANIRKNCKLEITETKLMPNKMFIKGICKLYFVNIADNEEKFVRSSFDVPFSEVLDMYGLTEESNYDIFNVNTDVIVDKNINSEKDKIHVNIEVNLNVMLTKKTEINFIDDIYSVKSELNSSFSELNYLKLKDKCSETITLSFIADTFIEDAFSVCDSYIDNIKLKYKAETNNIEVSAEFNAVLKLSDDSYAFISRSYNNEFKLNKNIVFRPEIINSELLSISALQASESNIRFTADLSLFILGSEYCKENILTDAVTTDNLVSYKGGIIIYYASKGEKMWDIAKENKSSVDVVKCLNGISEDEITENKMLIIANN